MTKHQFKHLLTTVSRACPVGLFHLQDGEPPQIKFDEKATAQQKADAENIVSSFDPKSDYRTDDEKLLAALKTKVENGEDIDDSEVKFAVIQWLKDLNG